MEVPIIDKEGKLRSVNSDEAQLGIRSKDYVYATPNAINKVKYAAPEQQLYAGLEGFGQGIAGPLAPLLERSMGVEPEDILGREEAHPGTHYATEALGFIAPALATWGGSAMLRAELEAAGLTGEALNAAVKAKMSGIPAQAILKGNLPGAIEKASEWIPKGGKWYSKIPLNAGKMAYEGALMGVADQASRAVLQDPNQTADTVIPAIGLSSLFGGVLGTGAGVLSEILGKGAGKAAQEVGVKLGEEMPPEGQGEAFAHTPDKDPHAFPEGQKEGEMFVSGSDVNNYEKGDLATVAKYHGNEMFPDKPRSFINKAIGSLTDLLGVKPKENIKQIEDAARLVTNNPGFELPVGMMTHDSIPQLAEDAALKLPIGPRDAIAKPYNDIHAGMEESLTKLMNGATGKSDAEVGKIGHQIAVNNLDDLAKARSAQWEPIMEKFNTVDFANHDNEVLALSDELRALKDTFTEATGPHVNEVERAADAALWNKNNLEDIKEWISKVKQREYAAVRTGNTDVADASGKIVDVLDNFVEKMTGKLAENPALSAEQRLEIESAYPAYKRAQKEYPSYINKLKKLGEYVGLKQRDLKKPYLVRAALKDMSPDVFFSKLSSRRDVNFLNFINQEYPDIAQWLKQADKEKFYRLAKTKKSHLFSKNMMDTLRDLSKEERNHMFTPEENKIVDANLTLDKEFPWNKNFSNTSNQERLMDALKFGPAGVAAGAKSSLGVHTFLKAIHENLKGKKYADGGMVSGGGNNLADSIAQHVTPESTPQTVPTSEDEDYSAGIKNQPFFGPIAYAPKDLGEMMQQPPQVRSSLKLAQEALKGHKMSEKALSSVFDPKSDFAVSAPKPAQIDKLKKQLGQIQKDPMSLMKVGQQVQHLPEMAQAFTSKATSAAEYLNSLKPKEADTLPFDNSKVINAKTYDTPYDRALKIAEQPLLILTKVKQGTVNPSDVAALKALYPSLYQNMSQKITEHLIEHKAQNKLIPYHTRMGLSMFLGQPLDSTMKPQSIVAAQPKPVAPQQPQGGGKGKGGPHSTKPLTTMANMAKTPGQNREEERSTKH